MRTLAGASVVAVAASVAACGAARPGAPSSSRDPGTVGGLVASNVVRTDYAGSAACEGCHPGETAAWRASPMHRMTRDARGADVRAPFDGTRWTFHDDALRLEMRGEDRFVRIEPASGSPRTYRVTRVIGGRTREDFAGVDVAGGPEEVVLPVSFVFAPAGPGSNPAGGTLRYKGYSVMVHERTALRAGPVWSRTCIFCHNTVPELDRLVGAVAGRSAHAYQGEQVDTWLPEALRSTVRVTDSAAFAQAVAAEVATLGGRPSTDVGDARRLARTAVDVVRAGFDARSLVEVGIGCEACHGGSRAHALDPRIRPSLSARAPWLSVSTPISTPTPASTPASSPASSPATTSTPAQAQTRMCARCHQVLFSRYPFTWEGGRRDAAPGGSHIASGEARDFLLGGCAGAMTCTTCHDPHGGDTPEALRRLASPEGNARCTPCHRELEGAARLREHAHHDPTGAGGACIACHMARKNMGLGGTLTRYHRIGSPTDAARVLGDRPLECALCHVDRSVAQLADAMEAWWPVRYPRQRLAEMYGSLDANVVRATLERGRPHEQAVAVGRLGEARAKDAAPLVARVAQASEYPLVREWARRALDAMTATAATAATSVPTAPTASASPARPAGADADEDPED